ncbi:MAG: hypothetical protein QXJ28_00300 [Candidatus Pacearchaeota archaeon]
MNRRRSSSEEVQIEKVLRALEEMEIRRNYRLYTPIKYNLPNPEIDCDYLSIDQSLIKSWKNKYYK